jgi:DNA-3-methyladenine glycosylase I
VTAGLVAGPDGRPRCWWATSAPEYVAYHDEEWGTPVRGDDALFERICLEAFQAGLSWITILRRRPAFRQAFADFRIDEVSRFDGDDVERLMHDSGIVRNRPKIDAAIANAKAAKRLGEEGTSLTTLLWQHAPQPGPAPRTRRDVPAQTTDSQALAKALKHHGFRFVGPTTAYATMQACGLVNDHLEGCVAR